MATIEELREDVKKNPNAEGAASVLLQGLGRQLAELVNDRRCSEKVSELATHLSAHADAIAADIVANTKGEKAEHRR